MTAAERTEAAGIVRPALVASDLDGTFLDPNGAVTETNAEAVHALAEAGIPFVVTTGRPPRWLQVLDGLPISAVVASNGAVLWDLEGQRPIRTHPIEVEVAGRLTALIRDRLPGVAFAAEQGGRFGWEADYRVPVDLDTSDHTRYFRARVDTLIADGPMVKLLVQHPDLDPDELAACVGDVVGDELTVTHSSMGEFALVEVSAAGITKASMLASYCAEMGTDAEQVAAFGDMPNDLAMLQWVGLPHVMADAHPDLVELDAVRIGSCADSAVGRTILGWL